MSSPLDDAIRTHDVNAVERIGIDIDEGELHRSIELLDDFYTGEIAILIIHRFKQIIRSQSVQRLIEIVVGQGDVNTVNIILSEIRDEQLRERLNLDYIEFLYCAGRSGNIDMVNIFLNNEIINSGLEGAAVGGHIHIVEYLLEHELANEDEIPWFATQALYEMFRYPSQLNLDIIDMLLDYGAKYNIDLLLTSISRNKAIPGIVHVLALHDEDIEPVLNAAITANNEQLIQSIIALV